MKKPIFPLNSISLLGVLMLQVCLLPLGIVWTADIATAQANQLKPIATPPNNELPQTTVQFVLEPKAIAILKAASERLASARTMTFTAISTYESPSRLGPPLIYTTISEVALQRPNKLRVISPGDGAASEFYYDGKTMMAYAPAENLVAVAEAPPTIDGALQAAHEVAAIYFPFTDVLVADPYQDIADGLKLAFYMGQSQIVGGTTTDMIAIGNDKVFAQVWIGANDHLPRMIRAVYADDPLRLRHQVEFTNWQRDVAMSSDAFASSRANNAKRMEFKRPDPPAQSPAKVERPEPSR